MLVFLPSLLRFYLFVAVNCVIALTRCFADKLNNLTLLFTLLLGLIDLISGIFGQLFLPTFSLSNIHDNLIKMFTFLLKGGLICFILYHELGLLLFRTHDLI